MSARDTTAAVMLWGTRVGAVTWAADEGIGYFQYDQDFLPSGIELAPFRMPLQAAPYTFPALAPEAFKGLPGMLADVLPDKFGNRLIDAWLARDGRRPEEFNPVERLCYVGTRGMGALEFKPALGRTSRSGNDVDVARLVELANAVLAERTALTGKLDDLHEHEALDDILRVGTSAGGARAKAVLAWNPETGEFKSGQAESGQGFEHWLLKFDGVSNNRDKELADPLGFGLIEYAYYKMAIACEIDMSPCRLFKEGGLSHFMTRRFDRVATDTGGMDKLHMQSLAALQHYDFNDSAAYSYEQALLTIRDLDLGVGALEQQYRRSVFNIIARNQDDHVKNIAFLMDRLGHWSLAPAFDVTYSYNPSGDWTGQHQMSTNGKRKGFTREDLLSLGRSALLKKNRCTRIVDSTIEVVSQWPTMASEAGVDPEMTRQIASTHRLAI